MTMEVQPPSHPVPIAAVVPNSPAFIAGIQTGWELLTVNGVPIPDILAYRRELAGGRARLVVQDPESGGLVPFTVAWEDPGLEFSEVVFDGLRLCANKCEFCYIHQMPQGFRKSLYVMDDDFRTSFLYGSFITLTNLSEHDVARILDENLSPLYVFGAYHGRRSPARHDEVVAAQSQQPPGDQDSRHARPTWTDRTLHPTGSAAGKKRWASAR